MNDAHVAAAYSIGAPFAHKGLYDFRKTAMTRTVQSDAQVLLVCSSCSLNQIARR